jgi:hypothetical protein
VFIGFKAAAIDIIKRDLWYKEFKLKEKVLIRFKVATVDITKKGEEYYEEPI